LIVKDFDGLYYLNYFNAINHIYGLEDGILSYFKPLRKIIIEYQDKAENDLSIKSKYLWLKRKYNSALRKNKEEYINEKKQKENPDSYKYIKDIEEISKQIMDLSKEAP
jgi:hypothetical protein